MSPKRLAPSINGVETLIREIRGQKVILDSDLAALYGVTTKRLNEQYRRNRARFPEDFAFRLTPEEVDSLRSQIATSSSHGGRRYLPRAFTEHGALMAANILNSSRAVQMSVFVIRAFVKMREALLGTHDLAKKLASLEKKLTGRLDAHEAGIIHVLQELMLIINPPRSLLKCWNGSRCCGFWRWPRREAQCRYQQRSRPSEQRRSTPKINATVDGARQKGSWLRRSVVTARFGDASPSLLAIRPSASTRDPSQYFNRFLNYRRAHHDRKSVSSHDQTNRE